VGDFYAFTPNSQKINLLIALEGGFVMASLESLHECLRACTMNVHGMAMYIWTFSNPLRFNTLCGLWPKCAANFRCREALKPVTSWVDEEFLV
jgi:hypothetical protein